VRTLPEALRQAPFTTAAARATGLRPSTLRGPAVERLFSGVYRASGSDLSFDELVQAALLVGPPDALVTGVTALRLRGAAVGPVQPVHLVTTHPHPVRRPGLRVTRVAVLPPATGRVVDAEAAFLAAAPALDLVELVTAGDHLVRAGRVTPSVLQETAARARGRGTVLARRAAGLVRDRVDSPQETELRLCLVLAGLPEPVCNLLVGDDQSVVGRGDLVYRRLRIVLEYEGDQHRKDVRQWNRDIERQEHFDATGWRLVRVTSERMRRPRSVVIRVLQVLRAAGYEGPDPVFSPEWTALFEPTVRSARTARAFQRPQRTVAG
jgi:hypothetical protein